MKRVFCVAVVALAIFIAQPHVSARQTVATPKRRASVNKPASEIDAPTRSSLLSRAIPWLDTNLYNREEIKQFSVEKVIDGVVNVFRAFTGKEPLATPSKASPARYDGTAQYQRLQREALFQNTARRLSDSDCGLGTNVTTITTDAFSCNNTEVSWELAFRLAFAPS